MTKSDLIRALSHELQITPGDAAGVVTTILDAMTSTLIQGENIEIRGFGSFTIKHYDSFLSRNPKTREKVIAKSKKLPFFKPGKELRESVNEARNNRKIRRKKTSKSTNI
jgi:integration host factor subunit beta